jgi:hypothetical protein
MGWPNQATWSAGAAERLVAVDGGSYLAWTIDCGLLHVPSGELVACDPFASLTSRDNPHVLVPPGKYPVTVTLADVSPGLNRSHIREAYATVRVLERPEAHRRALPLARRGELRPILEGDNFIGFTVDAGTACFVDNWSVENCMPDSDTWHEALFENDRQDCWFSRMDDPNHIRVGIANIVFPLARNGENVVIIHSGWGDGVFPIVGSFDADDNLIAVHIDFGVIP